MKEYLGVLSGKLNGLHEKAQQYKGYQKNFKVPTYVASLEYLLLFHLRKDVHKLLGWKRNFSIVYINTLFWNVFIRT